MSPNLFDNMSALAFYMEHQKKNRIEIVELFSLHLGLLLVPLGARPNHVGRKYRELRKNYGIKEFYVGLTTLGIKKTTVKHTDIAKYGLPDNLF